MWFQSFWQTFSPKTPIDYNMSHMVFLCKHGGGSLQLFRAPGFWHGSTEDGFDCAVIIEFISRGLGPLQITLDAQ